MVAARHVDVTFSWPYYHVTFLDDAGQDPEELNRIVLDLANDLNFKSAQEIIDNATKLWLEGKSFSQVWHQYNDV